jgi:LmbE family N-acetylglucosaminyl deacetylase
MQASAAHAAMRAFPVAPLEALIGGTALVLAPHPDDESIGCGGIIALLCDAGRPPVVMVMTDGAFSHPGSAAFPPERLRVVREAEARAAVRVLGVPEDRVLFLGLADGAAPVAGEEFETAVGAVEDAVREFGCSVVLAPWSGDPHCDHEAVQLMARAVVDRSLEVRLLSYPVWGWLLDGELELAAEPVGWRVEVESVLERKRRAIAAHASQIGGLIADDPAGFSLPAALLEACVTSHEVFVEDRRS